MPKRIVEKLIIYRRIISNILEDQEILEELLADGNKNPPHKPTTIPPTPSHTLSGVPFLEWYVLFVFAPVACFSSQAEFSNLGGCTAFLLKNLIGTTPKRGVPEEKI